MLLLSTITQKLQSEITNIYLFQLILKDMKFFNLVIFIFTSDQAQPSSHHLEMSSPISLAATIVSSSVLLGILMY